MRRRLARASLQIVFDPSICGPDCVQRLVSDGVIQEKPLEEVEAEMQTGDVVLFSGHWKSSNKFKLIQKSFWSHAGMIIRLGDKVCILESTNRDTSPDVEEGFCRKGVQLVYFKDRLEDYWGDLAWRKLDCKRDENFHKIVEEFKKKIKGRPYENNVLEGIKAIYKKNKKENLDAVFCSELIAACYQRLGILSKKISSNNYHPVQFAQHPNPKLNFLNGANLGDIIRIKKRVPSHCFSEMDWLYQLGYNPSLWELRNSTEILDIHLKKAEVKWRFPNIGIKDILPDYYVVFLLGQEVKKAIHQWRSAQSSVQKNNANPVWDEHLYLLLPHREKHNFSLRIFLWNKDKVRKDDYVGSATLRASEWQLNPGETKDFTVKLQDGEIFFSITRRVNPDHAKSLIEQNIHEAEKTEIRNLQQKLRRKLIDKYPEMKWKAKDAVHSPEISEMDDEKKPVFSFFGEDERLFQRVTISLLCLDWALKGDYDAFTTCQEEAEDKLTRSGFEVLSNFTKSVLKNEAARDAMTYFALLNHMGRVKPIMDLISERTGVNEVESMKLLYQGLLNTPTVFPSFTRLQTKYQIEILESLNAQFRPAQFLQAENLPANLQGLKNISREALDFFLLHSIFVIAGAAPTRTTVGSMTLTESTWIQLDHIVTSLELIPQNVPCKEVYSRYLDKRGESLKIPCDSNKNYAILRLCCMMRFHKEDEGKDVLEAVESFDEWDFLESELCKSGIDDGYGTLLFYSPALCINTLVSRQNEDRKSSVLIILKTLSRIYRKARDFLKDRQDNGVFILNISEVANLAKSPELLDQRSFRVESVGMDGVMRVSI